MDEGEFNEQDYIQRMKGPLPFVTPATMKVFGADKDKGYLTSKESINTWLGRFTRENPALKGYLDGYLSGLDDNTRAHVLWAVVGMYELLRRQAESDQLQERFDSSG